jgi:hypothetical protein
MAERHGKNGRLIINAAIVKVTKTTLSFSKDKVEVSGYGDANKIYVLGKKDLQGSISGFWDDASDKLFDAMDSDVGIMAYLYPDAVNAPTQYWYGLALFDGGIDVDSNGAVAVNGSLVAAGPWTRVGVP